jgi:ABC-type molybdate transport system permease subunit
MRPSEVFLRLGVALVAWMMLYAHVVWLAALHAMGCGPDGDELHRLLLGLAPLTCGFALLLHMTRPFADIHRILRWLGAPC